jgi:hypothetical protein
MGGVGHGPWRAKTRALFSKVEFLSQLQGSKVGRPLEDQVLHSSQIEAEIAAWYDATSLNEEKMIVRRLNRLAVDHVLFAPLCLLLARAGGLALHFAERDAGSAQRETRG